MICCEDLKLGCSCPLFHHKRVSDLQWPATLEGAGIKPIGHTHALIKIEAFVDAVISRLGQAYKILYKKDAAPSVTKNAMADRLFAVLPYLGLFDSYSEYSEMPYVFLQACWNAEREYGVALTSLALNPGWVTANHRHAEMFNWILDQIRTLAKQRWFTRGDSDRSFGSKCRAGTINKFMCGQLQARAKSLLVRFDLYYKPEVQGKVTMERMMEDRRRFFDLRHHHPYFENVVGYIWAVEEAQTKGPHCHILLILDGSKVRGDITIGEMMAGLWKGEITGGEGECWISNKSKHRFERQGIGMIERADREACEAAILYATYLGKDPHGFDEQKEPQYIRMKPAGARTYGTSLDDAQDDRKLGRPVTTKATWVPEDFKGLRWERRFKPTRPGR